MLWYSDTFNIHYKKTSSSTKFVDSRDIGYQLKVGFDHQTYQPKVSAITHWAIQMDVVITLCYISW